MCHPESVRFLPCSATPRRPPPIVCSPMSSGSFSRGARHDPTWWPETQPCRAAVLGYQARQRSANRRERPRRRMTRRSCCAMLPIPFPPRDRGGRPGRADTTVTRHLSAAGSYQVTNAEPVAQWRTGGRPAEADKSGQRHLGHVRSRSGLGGLPEEIFTAFVDVLILGARAGREESTTWVVCRSGRRSSGRKRSGCLSLRLDRLDGRAPACEVARGLHERLRAGVDPRSAGVPVRESGHGPRGASVAAERCGSSRASAMRAAVASAASEVTSIRSTDLMLR